MPSETDDPISGLSPRALLAGGLTAGATGNVGERDLSGEQIGPYHLIEPIGEGGMGVVYLAEQEEPVERAVALKVVKRGMDTDELIARFALERKTLASLEHPHIARVLDAGATPGGRPYFVMELVDGVPITLFCQREATAVRGRIKLFLQACDAVWHAHRHGVIHRDIKPGNLLVSGAMPGDLKVIDFGIAKVARTATGGGQTVVGQVVGTPEYMCPEQAAGVEVDTRADVYSLGAVLGELVPEEDRVDEIRWIVLRAMEEDREMRYGSVADLAADLERFLNNRPILARRPSSIYRMRKFVRRNRGLVVASLMVLIAAGFGIWKMVEAKSLRRQADLAHGESEKASVVTVFVQELLEAMRVEDADERREALVMAVRYYDDNLGKAREARPEVAFLRQQMLGSAYRSLGQSERAERALIEAKHLATMFDFPDHDMPLLVAVETDLGELLIDAGRLDEAVGLAEDLVADPRLWASPELVNYLVDLGQSLCESNRHSEAEQVFLEAQQFQVDLSGEGSERWLHVTAWVAHAVIQLDRKDEAMELLEHALAAGEKRLGQRGSAEMSGLREDLRKLTEERQ